MVMIMRGERRGFELSDGWWWADRKVASAVGRCWLPYQLVGGGPTCLWLSPFPSSLLWRKRQMESEGSALVPARLLMAFRSEGTVPGEHGDHTWPRPSITTRVNCLQRGVALLPPPPTNPLLPPCGCKQQLHTSFEVLSVLRHFCPLTKVSQGLSAKQALKLSRLQATCKQLIFHREVEGGELGRAAKYMSYTVMRNCIFSKECFGWCMCDSMIRRELWCKVGVKRSCQNHKVLNSITRWTGDLYVTGFGDKSVHECFRGSTEGSLGIL